MIGLGATSQLGIGIAIKLHDQFSDRAKRINQQLLDMKKNSNSSALVGAMREYRNNATGVAAGATAASVGMFRMVRSASEYEHQLRKTVILGGKGFGKTTKDLHNLAKELTNLYPQTGYMDQARLFAENIRAGVRGWQDLKTISDYQLAAATATDEAADKVGLGIIGMLNAYEMGANQMYNVGGKMVSGIQYVANGLTQAANQSQASISDIVESMKYLAPVAKQSGMGLDQALAITAVMGNRSVLGSQAGVWSANAIRYLIKNTGMFMTRQTKDAWKFAGVDPKQMQDMINQGRIYDALQKIGEIMQPMSRSDQQSLYQKLFGERGSRAVIAAFTGAFANKSLENQLGGIRGGISDDIAKRQAAAMADDPYSELMRIKNEMFRFSIEFFRQGRPVIQAMGKIVMGVTKFMSAFVSTGIGKILTSIVMVGTPLIALLFGFRAAVFSAILALRGFSGASAAGGFRNLFMGGLGMLGMSRFGPLGGKIARNAAGRWTVAAGQTVSHGGRIYKGGQMLPQALLAMYGLGGMGGGPAVGGWLGRMGTRIGSSVLMRSGFMMGARSLLGMGLRFLPVVGAVMTIADLVGSWYQSDKEERNRKHYEEQAKIHPIIADINAALDARLFGGSGIGGGVPGVSPELSEAIKNFSSKPTMLNQNLNINIDGTPMYNKMNQIISDSTNNNNIQFEYPEF